MRYFLRFKELLLSAHLIMALAVLALWPVCDPGDNVCSADSLMEKLANSWLFDPPASLPPIVTLLRLTAFCSWDRLDTDQGRSELRRLLWRITTFVCWMGVSPSPTSSPATTAPTEGTLSRSAEPPRISVEVPAPPALVAVPPLPLFRQQVATLSVTPSDDESESG